MAEFAVKSVAVDASGLAQGVDGRKNRISDDQIERDLRQAFWFVFENRKSGKRQVKLHVRLRRFHLSSRGAAVFSPVPSHIIADIWMTDARTGKLVFQPVTYSGASDYDLSQPVNPISALTKLSVEKDYLDTIYSYAEKVNVSLFGAVDARKSKLSDLKMAN